MAIKITRPSSEEYAPYYGKYIEKVKGDDVLQILTSQLEEYTEYIKQNAERMDYRYGENKWSIRESLIHIIDTEQIFAYRALRICRGDKTPLAGFDQDTYIEGNDFGHITPWDILEELTYQRRATLSMIKKFKEDQLTNLGEASGSPTSTRALVYIIAGHAEHHMQLFRERYS